MLQLACTVIMLSAFKVNLGKGQPWEPEGCEMLHSYKDDDHLELLDDLLECRGLLDACIGVFLRPEEIILTNLSYCLWAEWLEGWTKRTE